jgi:hypothetical protein
MAFTRLVRCLLGWWQMKADFALPKTIDSYSRPAASSVCFQPGRLGRIQKGFHTGAIHLAHPLAAGRASCPLLFIHGTLSFVPPLLRLQSVFQPYWLSYPDPLQSPFSLSRVDSGPLTLPSCRYQVSICVRQSLVTYRPQWCLEPTLSRRRHYCSVQPW